MNVDIGLKRYLDDTLDRCFIYSIMLHRAEIFYSRMKMLFKLPIILTSSALSIVNSNFDSETMRNVNIVFNILTGFILAVGTLLQYESKQQEFCSAKRKFLKLNAEIEGRLLSNEHLEPLYINAVIKEFNSIEESLDYDIPQFILTTTRAKWKGLKTLPIIINGCEKLEIHRDKSLAIIPDERQLEIEKKIGCV